VIRGHDAHERLPRRADLRDIADRDQWLQRPNSFSSSMRRFPATLARRWSGSLQVRVAATTLLVTGVFVFIIGVFLVNQITAGVLRAKTNSSVAQANIGIELANRTLASIAPGDISAALSQLSLLSSTLTGTSADATAADASPNGGLYYISILTTSKPLQTALGPQPAIPAALSASVSLGNQAFQYAQIAPPTTGAAAVNSLVVGEPVDTSAVSIGLYYVFPLTAEQQTVALVERTVLFAGLGLMLLIALIAVLVTRQVVGPVAAVAESAQRMAGGDLSGRLTVRGGDELARLSRSFNDMATSLQRQFRRLEELSRLQRSFTSDVSHELRTPLTTVRMAAELLYARRDEFPADLNRSTELMHEELDRFEGLLGDLLEISRYDAGVARLELETVDVRTVVAIAIAGTQFLADAKGSQVQVFAPDHPVEATIDPRRIERILRNLLGNAIDHGEGRPVRVAIAQTDNVLTIAVRDFGVGLRPGEAGLVFNRFWRGDPSRSRLTGGTGLGLAISNEDARLHGGWLQAWGERGQGALFRLTIPVDADHPLPPNPTPLEPAAGPIGPEVNS
jgi:two-component system sensor histidine kinase MtrB